MGLEGTGRVRRGTRHDIMHSTFWYLRRDKVLRTSFRMSDGLGGGFGSGGLVVPGGGGGGPVGSGGGEPVWSGGDGG